MDKKLYYQKNKLKILKRMKKYGREYYLKNKEKINRKHREYYRINKKKIQLYLKKYYIKNIERIKKYYFKNRVKIITRVRKYYHLNKKKIRIWDKRYKRNRRGILNLQMKVRLKKDVSFRLKRYLRNRLYMALKGNPKLETTMKLVGCSIDFLKQYLEFQFRKGMTWDNWGKGKYKWNIDHIIPCCAFDLSKKKNQRKCFHYTNLQPLWEFENLLKGNKYLLKGKRGFK